MIFATPTVSFSTLKMRPVTRTLAPVRWPTLAAVSAETVPESPNSCSPKTFANSSRSTVMRLGSAESATLSNVEIFDPKSETPASWASKSKTARVRGPISAPSRPPGSTSLSKKVAKNKQVFRFIGLLR